MNRIGLLILMSFSSITYCVDEKISLSTLIEQVAHLENESDYNEFYYRAQKIINKLNTNGVVKKKYSTDYYQDFKIHPVEFVEIFGPLLSSYKNRFRHNVRVLEDPVAELGLAMLQDESFLSQIVEKIFNNDRYIQIRNIKLLTMYGPNAKPYIPLLQWLKNNHWDIYLKNVATESIKIIEARKTIKPWQIYKDWQSLKKTSLENCPIKSNFNIDSDIILGNFEQGFNLNLEDEKELKSLGFEKENIGYFRKNIFGFKYIFKENKNMDKLILVNETNAPQVVNGGSEYFDFLYVFEMSGRLFFITKPTHHGTWMYFIDELRKGNDGKYFIDRSFNLGENLLEISNEGDIYFFKGVNWEYQISNAIVVSGILCNNNVSIYKLL